MLKVLKSMRWYYWLLIILIGFLTYFQVTLELELPDQMNKIVREVTNAIILDNYTIDRRLIFSVGLVMLGIVLSVITILTITVFLTARIGAGIASDLRREIFQKVERFSLEEISHFSTPSLITRTTNDVMQIQMVIIMVIRLAFMAPITGIKAVTKALEQSRELSNVILIAVLFLAISFVAIFMIVTPRFSRIQKLTDQLNLVTRESLTGIRVVRASNAERIQEEKFNKVNTTFKQNILFVNRVGSLMMPIQQLTLNGLTLGLVWLGAIIANQIADVQIRSERLASILQFQQYAVNVVFAFMMMTMLVIFVPRGIVSARRIKEVLETEATVHDPDQPITDLKEPGAIEFRNVTFQYPDAEKPVIENISFRVNPGETVALIGSTGSGKSTIINLIPRFFDATEGEVLVNGVNVKDVKQEDLRNTIGYVPQRGVLFRGTIRSNLTYGRKEATDEEIREALRIAQALEFVNKLPEGIDAPIAQGGTNVSGGQKQRLNIARAIIKKPLIYIFDDSFSALDFKTERTLREELAKATAGATKVIVAQRVGTIMDADQIIVLDKGKIVGIGTHKELMKTCEVYQEIALSQLAKEELE